jgi:hypothetical protein
MLNLVLHSCAVHDWWWLLGKLWVNMKENEKELMEKVRRRCKRAEQTGKINRKSWLSLDIPQRIACTAFWVVWTAAMFRDRQIVHLVNALDACCSFLTENSCREFRFHFAATFFETGSFFPWFASSSKSQESKLSRQTMPFCSASFFVCPHRVARNLTRLLGPILGTQPRNFLFFSLEKLESKHNSPLVTEMAMPLPVSSHYISGAIPQPSIPTQPLLSEISPARLSSKLENPDIFLDKFRWFWRPRHSNAINKLADASLCLRLAASAPSVQAGLRCMPNSASKFILRRIPPFLAFSLAVAVKFSSRNPSRGSSVVGLDVSKL